MRRHATAAVQLLLAAFGACIAVGCAAESSCTGETCDVTCDAPCSTGDEDVACVSECEIRCAAGAVCDGDCSEGCRLRCDDSLCKAGGYDLKMWCRNSACHADCPSGVCSTLCEDGSTCSTQCDDNCNMLCEGGSSCDLLCRQGDACNVTCDAGSDCRLVCADYHTHGACVLCCADPSRCELVCPDSSRGATCSDGRMVCDVASCDAASGGPGGDGDGVAAFPCYARPDFESSFSR